MSSYPHLKSRRHTQLARMRRKVPDVGTLLKGHFFTGLLVIIPIGVIAWILISALRSIWGIHEWLPEAIRPENHIHNEALVTVVNTALTFAIAVLLAFGVSFLGWISKHYLGRKLLQIIAFVIQRIPLIRSIYGALDQLLRTLVTGSGGQFSRVVYVEYPRKGLWSIAFVTGPAKGAAVPPGHLNVFVPTTPNPTSGFHFLAPESEVRDSHMKVEEAFRTIISLGLAQPDQSAPKT